MSSGTVNVDESSFPSAVLRRSSELPVVVDFWAEWCAPCRALGPLLESAAAAREGQVVLAKVDTDANPTLSRSYGIQGIPAVKAFRDGEVVAEFVGAQPPGAVERFFDGLVPSEADGLVAAGDEGSLRRALELDPTHRQGAVALARLLRARGEGEAALAILDAVPEDFQVDGLRARIRLEGAGAQPNPVEGSTANTTNTPPGAIAGALAALDGRDAQRGLELLIAQLPGAEGEHRDDIRRVVVAELDTLGVEHPLAREARRKLAAVLY